MPTLTARDLNRALLARQLLLEPAVLSPVDAIERLVGMQAQEPAPPFTGLWTRLAEFDADDLSSAILSRVVVRATLLRGTLHLFTAVDYQRFRAALQPALDLGLKVLGDRADGLDSGALLTAARDTLTGSPLTFAQLRPLLQARFPDADDRALGYATRLQLPLVMEATGDPYGFPRGTARFTLADAWLGAPHDPDPAPDELVLRYLAAFGPATPKDFQAWSGIPGAAPAFERLRSQLVTFQGEGGHELFDLPDAPRPAADTPAPVRLIPEFDNLVLGHADRTRIISEERRPQLTTSNLRVRATFLLDGFVGGTWRVERTKRFARIFLEPFAPLTKRNHKALMTEAERLLGFTDADVPKHSFVVVDPA
jgi:hypothetical protein